MTQRRDLPDFFSYLAKIALRPGEDDRLPTLQAISETLGVSVSRLREELEVARWLGFVEVRPRTGIRRLPYRFEPSVSLSLNYAIRLDRRFFEDFSELRTHLEASYWFQAAESLQEEDLERLRALVSSAWQKLRGTPVRIPHKEHRALHLTIFSRLENPFVEGILEGYWEAYEAVGLNLYADYAYLKEVWGYHQRMVDSLCSGAYQDGYEALIEHNDLLYHRPIPENPEEDGVKTISSEIVKQ